MFKKLVLVLAIISLFAMPVHAASVRRVISETVLTKGNSEATITLRTGDTDKLTFYVKYVTTNTGTVDITLDASYDGTNFDDANFYDYSGGGTLQTTEALSATTWYWLAWDPNITAEYTRIHIIGDTWAAASEATITVYVVEQR